MIAQLLWAAQRITDPRGFRLAEGEIVRCMLPVGRPR
jgi:hypothetical protein